MEGVVGQVGGVKDTGPDPLEEREYREYAITAALGAMTEARAEAAPWPENVGTPEYLREAGLAAFVELGELMNELPWKPWKKYPETMSNEIRANVLAEWADVEVFLTLLRRYLAEAHGFRAEDFARAYLAKLDVVAKRSRGEVQGYGPENSGSCAFLEQYAGPCPKHGSANPSGSQRI